MVILADGFPTRIRIDGNWRQPETEEVITLSRSNEKPTPTAIRRALADRLPGWAWLQQGFTWLTGIAMPGETRRRPWTATTHLWALVATWAVALLVGTVAMELLMDALGTLALAGVSA